MNLRAPDLEAEMKRIMGRFDAMSETTDRFVAYALDDTKRQPDFAWINGRAVPTEEPK